MPTLSQVLSGAKKGGISTSGGGSLSASTQKFINSISYAGKNTTNPIPSSGITLKPFQESNFIGFTGFGTDTKKQFSIGNTVTPDFKSGTRFISETEAKDIGAITDQGKSSISGKGIFTTFSDLFRNTTNTNLVNLGLSQQAAKTHRDSIEGKVETKAEQEHLELMGEGIRGWVSNVQENLNEVNERLSGQVTDLGKDNGDGGAFWDNLAAGLGIGLPVLAIGGIAAAVLLLRK